MTSTQLAIELLSPDELVAVVDEEIKAGGRFSGLIASPGPDGATRLRALMAKDAALWVLEATLPAGRDRYRALTPAVPAAFWYEREIHDLFGLVPVGHHRVDPLVYPIAGEGKLRPRPGRPDGPGSLGPDVGSLAGHVTGEGVFTIPYGPVRSGVFEAVEYLVETYGEDIPHLRVRPYLKHRGMARRFCEATVDQAVLIAERVEGTMSVAHAVACCQAIESLAGVEPPLPAQMVRVVHGELERIANHLESMLRHTEAAGQAVAHARLGWHKERVMRFRSALCGHRFGRGVVTPGGVTGPPLLAWERSLEAVDSIDEGLSADLGLLMTTPSFLDRLRGTGVIPANLAIAHGALGPVGRASGAGPDVRSERPYGAYRMLGFSTADARHGGDALDRQWIRVEEIATAWHLVRQALDELRGHGDGPWRVTVEPADGTAVSSVESAQGELLYMLDTSGGRIEHAKPRTASFHNFSLFPEAFRGDIFTDFAFIEASFAASIAGVAG